MRQLTARLVARDARDPADAAALKAQQAAHERAIEEYAGDDPLAPWLAYLTWMKHSFPTDSEGSVAQTLTKVTDLFSSDARYTNSSRYVKLWVERAVIHEKLALEIFQHMHAKNIGGDLAIFWNGYALVAERAQNFLLTDKVFTEGLARGAKPVETLRKKRRQFNRRLVRHTLNRQMADDAAETIDTAVASDAVVGAAASEGIAAIAARKQLRAAGGGSRRRRNPAALASIPVVAAGDDPENAGRLGGRGGRRSRGLGGTQRAAARRPAQVEVDDFEIYVPGREAASAPVSAAAAAAASAGAAALAPTEAARGESWGTCVLDKFGDAAERERENERKVEAWNGATLAAPRTRRAQRVALAAAAEHDEFEIFTEAAPVAPVAPVTPVAPLPVAPAAVAAVAAPTAPTSSAASTAAKKKKETIWQFDEAALMEGNSAELGVLGVAAEVCFEELRFAKREEARIAREGGARCGKSRGRRGSSSGGRRHRRRTARCCRGRHRLRVYRFCRGR